MSRETEALNRHLLRARDAMDRAYAEPLDVRAVAAVAHLSEAHFIRSFRTAFGETPHRYLQRRRVERALFLYETLKARGVTDFTQEPTDHFYGTDMGIRDPFGNAIRILQPAVKA
jgi:AraC-like DNA-binding protein